MRDLSRTEIEEYFAFTRRDYHHGGLPPGFSPEQTHLIGAVMRDCGILDSIGDRALEAKRKGFSLDDTMLSLFVSCFQLGRECESRLLTRALQAGAGAQGEPVP